MKKLLFAIVGAASFAALAADPTPGANDIDVLGFENFNLTDTEHVTGAVVDRTDSGVEGTSKWSCSGDDASLVKTYGGDNAAKGNGLTFPGPFEDEGNQYLALDTNGAELQRFLNPTDTNTPITVAADGTYIDTLIQFTPSESAPTDLDGAKLAIWLGVDSEHNTTNLMVAGAYYMMTDPQDETTLTFTTSTNYTLSGTYEPGTWYRLTVKAIPTLANGAEGQYLPGFVIAIDGQTLSIAGSATDSPAYTILTEGGLVTGANKDLLDDNQFIPALGVSDTTVVPALTSVGFKGTGALDDFVVTTEAPDFKPAPIDFSLTWPAGVTPVSYTIDGGEAVPLTGATSGTHFSVPAGSTVAFTFTNADGATKTMSLEAAADANEIDASTATYVWADYLGDAVNGAYTIDDANDLDMLRKGVDAGIATTGETFKQTANIDMTSAAAFAGIGATGQENAATLTALAFEGTYDGGNYTISNITFTNRKGSGLFNLIRGATIKDLVVDTVSYESAFAATKLGGAMVVGNGVNCTLRHIVTRGSNGLNNPVTYNAAGIADRLEGRGGPVLVEGCTNSAAIYCIYTKLAGICAIVQGDTETVTFVDCANTGSIVAGGTAEQLALNASDKKPGADGVSGILAYSQGGNGTISLTNCVNSGTLTGTTDSTIATIIGKTSTAGITVAGGSAQADIVSIKSGADKVSGIKFATVDNGVATFVADDALALNGSYKVMSGNATATFVFTDLGSISFDEALSTPTYAITASGVAGNPTSAKVGDVTTWTAGYFPRTATAGQDGSAANPFEIADVDDLQALAAYTAGHGLSYIQTADIDMATAGTFPGIGGDFTGTYDGGDKTISNLKFAANTYRGLFNKTTGATIKNLTIDTVSFETPGSGVEFGGAAFVGKVYANTVLSNLTAKGSVAAGTPGNHNVAGIAARVYATGAKFIECSNEASLYAETRKLGGILTIIQGTASVDFIGCSNSGTLVTTTKTHHDIGDDKDYDTGADGLAGIIGYANAATTLKDCVNTGTIQTHAENTKASIGGLIGKCGSVAITDLGGNKCAADMKMIGTQAGTITGFQYATVDDGTPAMATTTDTLATNTTFLLERNVAASATPVFTLAAEGEWIEFDKALGYTFAGTVAGANTTNETGTVVRYSWAAPQPAYPTYVGEDATLKSQYDTWKTTNGADSQSAYEKQFLLNVAPGTTVADDALVIESIAENATAGWDIVVSTTVSGAALSDGSSTTYNGYLLVKAANDLAGLSTATPVAYPVTAVTGGKVSITVTAGKFMKVVLTTTAPAQN